MCHDGRLQMADRMKILLLLAGVALPMVAGAQPMDYAARLQFEASVAALSDPLAADTLADDAGAVMATLGLTLAVPAVTNVAPPSFVADGPAVIELVDIRLLLTQIATQTGARDHIALVRAQGARDHGVILLRGGFASLDNLVTLAKGTPAQDFVTATPEGLVLTRPLAIWADAGLTLGAKDSLILDRSNGSFIANLGWLNLSGGLIAGAGGPNVAEPDFRPFVLTAGRGSFTANAATFSALGFGDAPVFGGIAIVNNGLVQPPIASMVTGSTLFDVSSLGLLGTKGAMVTANTMTGSKGTTILLSDAQASVVASNRLDILGGAQAIRVTAGASDVTISGNLVSGSARTGILIDRDSRDVTIAGNLVQGSLNTGIGIESAVCVSITANLVSANGGVGITLSDTADTTISTNAILFNQGSGILLRQQAPTALVHVADNVFVGNREGLRGATPGKVSLGVNDLERQLPRVFAGDLAPLTVDWLRNRRDAVATGLSAPVVAPCADRRED